MSNYDFHALLEPLEFQDLVCDLVQIREEIFLETYKEGRDSGIDGLFVDGTQKVIVQVKRYKQDFKRLYRDLKNVELPKVRKLDPDRYILGISMDFTPQQKGEIKTLFEGYIVSTIDILTKKDINNLLSQSSYKQVELKHPKLWLPSINVFKKLLKETAHRALYKESEEELKDAIKAANSFAPTRIYYKALHQLSQHHVILLSGEPGVGKTTMAYLLALAYLQPNYLDGFVWANSISDIYTMLEDDRKQVIILDDFWGSIFHEEHGDRNAENRLNNLIRRIIASKGDKRLILTTREYILQQGLQKHPALKDTLDQYALICTMEEYSDAEKARILFRHLYASHLDYEYVYYLYIRCDWIVQHRNYNPRVLALFLDKEPGQYCSPYDYFEELRDYFNNPGSFWKSIFSDLSREARVVAMLLLISSTPMRFRDMERCYHKYIDVCPDQFITKNLGECLAELEKTMVKSFYSEEREEVLLKFSMPAVQDFLYEYIKNNSQQCIPLIIRCCGYFNQLQFLLEHYSVSCSDRVADLIIQECIENYNHYDDSYVEYDGSWNWHWDIEGFEDSGCLDRFFHLLRCCDPERHHKLFQFLDTEIKDYCLSMGSGNRVAQYVDLHCLPDIIVRCIDKGMTFNGNEIITKYYGEAFSVYHYRATGHFQKVFPKEYNTFYDTHIQEVKRELENIIISELLWLNELEMDLEYDMLLDSLPDLLEEFGLCYTKEFEDQINEMFCREPISGFDEEEFYELYDYVDRDEKNLEFVKIEAMNWLLGPCGTDLGYEEVGDLISKSNLTQNLKTELKIILNSMAPRYVYDLLWTKESLNLLLATLNDLESQIPEEESSLLMMMLWHMCQGDQKLIKKLTVFCAESLMMIIHQEEPVLRRDDFLKSDVYITYLEGDSLFHDFVFENLILKDEQWVRFLHIPIFIICNALVIRMGCTGGELEIYYQDLWGKNFDKLKQIVKTDWGFQAEIAYAEIGSYHFMNTVWEGCMYRIFEEVDSFHFNQVYVEPMLKRYLDELGTGDDDSKVLNYLLSCKIEVEYTEIGVPLSSISLVSDELGLINYLSIAKEWDVFSTQIARKKLEELQKDERICKKVDGGWKILWFKITDIGLLKELGIYEAVLKFIQGVEKIYARLVDGDYSRIESSHF